MCGGGISLGGLCTSRKVEHKWRRSSSLKQFRFAAGAVCEDSAIAAEIDSLPVLVNQLNGSTSSQLNLLNSSVVKSQGLFEEISARGGGIPQPSSAPKRVASSRFLPLPNLANPAVGTANNNPQNSSLPSSGATLALSLFGSGGLDVRDKIDRA